LVGTGEHANESYGTIEGGIVLEQLKKGGFCFMETLVMCAYKEMFIAARDS
jgi:hypothetical protein